MTEAGISRLERANWRLERAELANLGTVRAPKETKSCRIEGHLKLERDD